MQILMTWQITNNKHNQSATNRMVGWISSETEEDLTELGIRNLSKRNSEEEKKMENSVMKQWVNYIQGYIHT